VPKPRVFVVQPIPDMALDVLRAAADVEVFPRLDRQIATHELVAGAQRADYLFVLGDTVVPAEAIQANPGLKAIGALTRTGANIDLEAARQRGLPIVIEAPDDEPIGGGVSLTTADLTVGMLLSLAYRVVDADRYTRRSETFQEQTMALMGIGCPGKTVGLIGLGKVARFMAPRLRAFDMRLLYTKRSRLTDAEEQALELEWAPSLDRLLASSDFVCVECDYNPSTHGLIGARELGLMKPTAYLINTARGRIVDEEALITSLQNRQIAGAALDVYWNEPPVTHDPFVPEALRQLDGSNVILAPHNGGATWDVRGSRMASVARGLVEHMQGRRPRGLLNPEVYATRV
jgi:lactate dehydrogenase-like 2-hydroxyacid dehydrogenase